VTITKQYSVQYWHHLIQPSILNADSDDAGVFGARGKKQGEALVGDANANSMLVFLSRPQCCEAPRMRDSFSI
jgi:hypothetical protein